MCGRRFGKVFVLFSVFFLVLVQVSFSEDVPVEEMSTLELLQELQRSLNEREQMGDWVALSLAKQADQDTLG